jgi:hypothetical protein
MQDWLNIRPFDPKNLKARICDALGVGEEEAVDVIVEPRFIQPGVERC